MRRREFIAFVGSTAAAWARTARAQQPALPVVAFIRDGSAEASMRYVAAFRNGLSKTGYVEGQNVTVEYHWLEGQQIACQRCWPVLFGTRWPSSLRPGVRIVVLVNPANASAESTVRTVQQAAPAIGLQIQILNATTIGEIDAAFATLERERPDALFVAGDAFFVSRAVQFATLAARDRIPATYALRDYVAAGGLMSYATDFTDSFRQVGVYTGTILKGAKPADLPSATDEIRVRHQPSNCAIARHRDSGRAARHRRRGDRIEDFCRTARFRFWHKADMVMALSDVRFWG
jgi:putative tryptophan/tyrosine transport system substrate-binding protein